MTSNYDPFELHDRDLADFGHARARDIAFDAVHKLWERRRSEGMTQADLAEKIGRDPAWISRNLRAPGNWTLRTLGELVAALDGCLQIRATAAEDAHDECNDFHARRDCVSLPARTDAGIESAEFPTFKAVYVATQPDATEDRSSGCSWFQADTAHGCKGQRFVMLNDDTSAPRMFMPEVLHAYS